MMTLGDSVTAMERAHDKMREERDGWRQEALRLQRDLDEAVWRIHKLVDALNSKEESNDRR